MDARIDGLTPQSLQWSRKSWWDTAFTRLLLDAIPLDTRLLVELECGLAAAAHALLPSLPEARYVGLNFAPQHLAEARTEVEGARFASRVELRLAAPEAMPLDDGVADVVLALMALQHRPDVGAALREAGRVLRSGGRVVTVEPDNLGQRFYFDGGLEEISATFHALCLKARVARQPADLALGPRLPALLAEAGLHQVSMTVHVVQRTAREAASAFFNRLVRVAETIAAEAGLPPESELVQACQAATRRCLYAGIPKRVGHSCHLVPVFLCVGRKL